MNTVYDNTNIFAKILRSEIPCKRVFDNKWALAFHDINPQAKLHVLIIPKGAYVSSIDFHSRASNEELIGYYRALDETLAILNLKNNRGFRLLSNSGTDAGQEIPHFHTHIFAGQRLGPMLLATP